MKTRAIFAFCLSLAIVVSLLTIPASAGMTRNNDVDLSLSFSNGVATCIVDICTDSTSNTVSATMELWRGNTRLNSWSESGGDSISLEETENVTRYHTYRLVVYYKVNGITQPSVEISRYYS